MSKDTAIKFFEEKQIRSVWIEEEEKWYFSVIDMIEILTESTRPRKYWNDLKTKLKKEGSELSEKIGQLKMKSKDGKFYQTDIADNEQLFRLIQSIPSPKAEPFKLWLAQVARERLEEIEDPEIGIDRHTQRLNPENGLCLCSIHDKAFEIGLIGIKNNYEIVLSKKLNQIKESETFNALFKRHESKSIILPDKFYPSLVFLEEHLDSVFKH